MFPAAGALRVMAAVAQLLWAAQGITASEGRRTAPPAGALYPLELHVAAARVADLAPGLYRYVATSHRLRPAAHGDMVPALARAAFSQQAVADAAAVVVIAAVEERTARKYGARAGRYVAFEAGAASQSLALQAAALGRARWSSAPLTMTLWRARRGWRLASGPSR